MVLTAPEEPKRYTVRLTPRVVREIEETYERIFVAAGSLASARNWYDGLNEKIASLRSLPNRFPLQENESKKMGLPVRRFLYQRASGGAAGYYVFYAVEEDSPDGPRVTVYHIRHAARRPMTAKEGREIVEKAEE